MKGGTCRCKHCGCPKHAVYDARVEMWHEVLRQIADVDNANITPLQALDLLNEMQMKVRALGD